MRSPLPASITKVMTLRDRTTRIQLDVQEVHPEHMAELFALNDTLGYFFFLEKPIKEIDTSNLPDIQFEKWEKHPSKRQRDIIFRLWEQTDRSKTFEVFYRETMDKICDWLKTKLN